MVKVSMNKDGYNIMCLNKRQFDMIEALAVMCNTYPGILNISPARRDIKPGKELHEAIEKFKEKYQKKSKG